MLTFPLGKRRGRLVEDQNPRLIQEGLRYLHHLLLRPAQGLDAALQLDVDVKFLKNGVRADRHLSPVKPSRATYLLA